MTTATIRQIKDFIRDKEYNYMSGTLSQEQHRKTLKETLRYLEVCVREIEELQGVLNFELDTQ